ncbi:MAG TPA: PilZ domain-containing protein [Candidatus Acidoferrales bacterium]|nr:PilZ domain-containing protein [Candidatus Acidoferrales bacterium]
MAFCTLVLTCPISPIELALPLYWFISSLSLNLDRNFRGRCPVALKERRASRRFLMRLPLTVRWTDESMVGEAATESREVSSRGLYFHLPKGLKSGSPVEIVMTLPHELTQAGPVHVRCLGRVLRSSPEHSGEVGVAAAIERYEFMRNSESAA